MRTRVTGGWIALVLAATVPVACSAPDPEADLLRIRRWEDRRTLAGDSLITILRDGHRGLRDVAARAIGRIGDPRGLDPLAEALARDARVEVRSEAAFALGILGHPDAVAPLAERLEAETDVETLGQIALALGRIGEPGTATLLHPLLQSPYPLLRERVVEALALLADSTSIDPLLGATHDPVESVIWRAAYALEKLPGERQVPRLEELCGSSSPLVRRYAVRALGRLGATRAVPALVGALEGGENDWRLRVTVAEALGRAGDAAAAEGALSALMDDPVFHVRVAVLQAIGRLRACDLAPRILDRREDPVVDVRTAAYDALADCLEGNAYEALRPGMEDPSDHVRATVLRRMGEADDARAEELILAVLDSPAPSLVRAAAAEGLSARGGGESVVRLRRALTDEDWVVATVAADALGQFGDEVAVQALLVATHRSGAGATDVRLAAVESLGELGDYGAVERLRELLRANEDVRVRIAARNALEELLDESEAAQLPSEVALRRDVRPVERSPQQPPVVAASRARQLVLHTEGGRVVIDLFGRDAPQTVESFARLAEDGFFDGLGFHRVVPNFVVQGGDPLGNGWGDPGYTLRSEWSPRRYERGTVGVAHSGKDTGGCQLFICLSPQPHLEARYTVFGQVVTGMEVVEEIQRGDTFRAEIVWMEEESGAATR